MKKHPPSRPELRRLLQERFPRPSDFEALLVDHFPEVVQRLSDGMDRVGRTNILLQLTTTAELWTVLSNYFLNEQSEFAEPVRRYEALRQERQQLQLDRDVLLRHGCDTNPIDDKIKETDRKISLGVTVDKGDILSERYRLVRLLQSTQFTMLWKAHDCREGTSTKPHIVIVKLLHGHLSGRSSAKTRFWRGFFTSKETSHSAIGEVIGEPNEDGPFCYYIMKYESEDYTTLEKGVQSGRLDREEAIAAILQVGDAVAKLHAKDIICRNIGPRNISVNETGGKILGLETALTKDNTSRLISIVGWNKTYLDDIHDLALTVLFVLKGIEIPNRIEPQFIAELAERDGVKAVLSKAIFSDENHQFKSMTAFCDALVAALAEPPAGGQGRR